MSKKEKNKVFALLPAYNEAPRIGKVLKELPKYVDEIIVVDDGSSDNTAEVARKYDCIVLKHKKNKGLGAAYKTGFRKFLQMNGDFLVTVHGDGQHRPEEIPLLVEPMIKNPSIGYVLGSRFMGRHEEMPLPRQIGNMLIKWLWIIATGYRLSDVLTGYHAISSEALKKIDINKLSNRFMIETDMLAEISRKKIKIAEVPVNCIFGTRRSYVSSVDGMRYCFNAIKFMFQRVLV